LNGDKFKIDIWLKLGDTWYLASIYFSLAKRYDNDIRSLSQPISLTDFIPQLVLLKLSIKDLFSQ